MTINLADNTPRVVYSVAEGVTQTSFTVPFEFFESSDVSVYVDDTLQTEGSNYTVTGGDGATGSITFSGGAVTGATGGSKVVLFRRVPLERTSDFNYGADINRGALNEQLDVLTAIAADLKDASDRSLHVNDYEQGTNLELPTIAARKGNALAFNAVTGNPEAGPSVELIDEALSNFQGLTAFIGYDDLIANETFTYEAGSVYSVSDGDTFSTTDSGLWEVAASGASDHHATTAGGVKLYEAGPTFSTRARAAAWIARGGTAADGTVISFPVGTGEHVATLVAQSGETDVPDFSGWAPADEWVHADVFGVPRGTDATDEIAVFLTYGFTSGRPLRFAKDTYVIDGAGADAGGVGVELASGYKDIVVDATGAVFQGGTSGNKLDNDMIRVNVASGAAAARDFHERPVMMWIGGFFDQTYCKNSTVVPNNGIGQLDTGSSATVNALNFRCNDSGEPAFSKSLIEGATFYCGDYWETAEAGDHQVGFNGLGNLTIRRCNFQGARDLGLYGGGDDANTLGSITVEECLFWNCYGSVNVKYDGNNITYLNNTVIDCVSGPSVTLGGSTTTGGERVTVIGNRCERVEVPFSFTGVTNLTGSGNMVVGLGYAYLTAWDNGVSSATINDRVTGVHAGGISQASGVRFTAVADADFSFSVDGINPNIDDGNTTSRAFTIYEGTVNSSTVQTTNLRVHVRANDVSSLMAVYGSATPSDILVRADVRDLGTSFAPSQMGSATNWAVDQFDMDDHTVASWRSGEFDPYRDFSRIKADGVSDILEAHRYYGGTSGDTLYAQLLYEQRSDGEGWATFSCRTSGGSFVEVLEVKPDTIAANQEIFANDGLRVTSGSLRVGTHSAIGAETVTGYITIKDAGGTDRKIAVVS